MNTIELLREQFKSAHDTQEAVMADVTADSAHFADTGKALPVGAAYAHSVLSEDMLMAMMLTHKAALATTAEEVGLSELMPGMDNWAKHEEWSRTVKVDLVKFREFAKKVYAASDEYLATLKEEDLSNEVDTGAFGKHPLSFILTNFFLLHIANLTGEMSAAKGVQGLKGYPF
jgi:hypothetical protein